ncbi:hypothetical protein HG530_001104 [Fusarium avenaceum]|nr:hypothetical protein HG530_001104 [Fusarium avenaceum]
MNGPKAVQLDLVKVNAIKKPFKDGAFYSPGRLTIALRQGGDINFWEISIFAVCVDGLLFHYNEDIVASYSKFQLLHSGKMTYKPNISAFEYAALRDVEDETNERHASCRS